MIDDTTFLVCNDGDWFDHPPQEHLNLILHAVKKRLPNGIVKLFAKITDGKYHSFNFVVSFLENDYKLQFSAYSNRCFLYYMKTNNANIDCLTTVANITDKDAYCINQLNDILLSFNEKPLIQEFYTLFEPFEHKFFTVHTNESKFADPSNAVNTARRIKFKIPVEENGVRIPFSLGANYSCHSCISKDGELYQFYMMSIGSHCFCIDTKNLELKVMLKEDKEINVTFLENISGLRSFKTSMIDDIIFESFSLNAQYISGLDLNGFKSSDYESIRDLMSLVSMVII